MKVKDVAKRYGLIADEFNTYLSMTKPDGFTIRFMDNTIDDDADIEAIVIAFKEFEAKKAEQKEKKEREKAEEKQRREKAAADKKTALANMLITSGFQFDGYKITKYSGYISGDDAVNVDRGFALFGVDTGVKDKLMESLVVIRRNALAELKEAAYALGCNAVVGVDFDYLTLDPQTANLSGGTTYGPYVFGVTANGNAVIIEKATNLNSEGTNK